MLEAKPRPADLVDLEDVARKKLVSRLLDRFSAVFPAVSFQLIWHSGSLNAQAVMKDDRRYVVVLGGLARHRRLGESGLAVALAHEVGHHLGGRPFDCIFPWLSCEGQADYWATRVGMKRVYGEEEAVARSLEGATELMDLYRSFYVRPRGPIARAAGRRVLPPRTRWMTLRAGALGMRRPSIA